MVADVAIEVMNDIMLSRMRRRNAGCGEESKQEDEQQQ
jgi:hypothetical protein